MGDFIMEEKKYEEIVKKHLPKENRIANALIAFLTGGLMGIIGQLLTSFYGYYFSIPTALANVFMIVTLIFFASLFTALGFFDKWVSFAKCGLIIPITGFAHSMMSAGLEYKNEGLIMGIGSNVFKLAGSVIFYGITSAWFFGLIRLLLLGGK